MADRDNLTTFEVIKLEMYRMSFLALILLFLQLLASILGYTGFRITIALYILTSIGSSRIYYDPVNGLELKSDAGQHPPRVYWTRSLVNLTIMTLGMGLWYFIGFYHGLEQTLIESHDPQMIMKKVTKKNAFLKLGFAYMSHFVNFAFWRIWTSSYNALLAHWLEMGSNNKP